MQSNSTTSRRKSKPRTSTTPPQIWEFDPIDDEQAAQLTEHLMSIGNLSENEELLASFIKLIAGIAAYHEPHCHCLTLCEKDVAWEVLKVAYIRTNKFNDSFFDYVVNDIRAAHDYRKKGGKK